MKDIEKCVKSDDKDCDSVKGITKVYQKEIQKQKH